MFITTTIMYSPLHRYIVGCASTPLLNNFLKEIFNSVQLRSYVQILNITINYW